MRRKRDAALVPTVESDLAAIDHLPWTVVFSPGGIAGYEEYPCDCCECTREPPPPIHATPLRVPLAILARVA
jgi:hypothetical protein